MLDTLLQVDQSVFLYLNNLGNESWDWFWVFITNKWSSIPLYLFLLFLLYLRTGFKATLFTGLMIVGLICFTDQFSNLLKNNVQRLRPCQLDLADRSIANCGRYGFPSAHAFSSMALAIFLGSILKKYYKYSLMFLVVWALFLGYSRIYVGVHYPGDVVVGFSLGTITGYSFYKTRERLLWSHIRLNYFKEVRVNPNKKHESFLFRFRYPLLWTTLGIITILYVRTEYNPESFILEDTPNEIYYEMTALLLSLLGIYLRIAAKIGKNKIVQTQLKKPSKVLNTCGIYSMFRHPFYVGNFLLLFGPVLWTGNYWFILFFMVCYWMYYTVIIAIEEQVLEELYGENYLQWKQQTPAFIPNFRNFKQAEQKSQWKKWCCNELKILFFLLVIFSSFNIVGEIIENKDFNYNYFIIGLCVLSGLAYAGISWRKQKDTFGYDEE